MMVKERVAESYGPILYTMGWGNSGSSIQQSMIADVYPGLIDGAVMFNGFPDNTNIGQPRRPAVLQLPAQPHARAAPPRTAPSRRCPNIAVRPDLRQCDGGAPRGRCRRLLNWSNSDIAAVSGFTHLSQRAPAGQLLGRTPGLGAAHAECRRPRQRDGRRRQQLGVQGRSSATRGSTARPMRWPARPWARSRRQASRRRRSARCRPTRPACGPTSPTITRTRWAIDPATGFGRSYSANVGVQYGLNALNSGQISMAQFINLNDKIGGVDIDGNHTAARIQPDVEGLKNAYRSGMIMYGGGGLAADRDTQHGRPQQRGHRRRRPAPEVLPLHGAGAPESGQRPLRQPRDVEWPGQCRGLRAGPACQRRPARCCRRARPTAAGATSCWRRRSTAWTAG